jgi:uncharacterized protein (DUF2141 family)
MKSISISILLLFSFLNGVQAQLKLEVEIKGIRNDNGSIMLELIDENEKVVRQEMSPVKEKTSSFLINDLTPGKYAVRYFHDENGNQKIDTSSIGRPVEGYGFSNNVPAKFGPPPFSKWLFEVKEDKKVTLSIIY